MKVMAAPHTNLEGKVNLLSCTECHEQARIKYTVGGIGFSLCLHCLTKLETLTSNTLIALLNEKMH